MLDFLSVNRQQIGAGVVSSVIVAILGAAITYLSKLPPVEVPLWVILAVVAFPVGWAVLRRRPKELKPSVGESFGVERVPVDGRHFVRCEFEGSELVFDGRDGFSLENCTFVGPPRFSFGEISSITLQQCVALYHDPALRPVIAATFGFPPEPPSQGAV